MNNTVYINTLVIVKDTMDFFNYLIEKYGEVKFIKYKDKCKELERFRYNDFIYYCFTKSVRSIYSAVELAEKYFREDSLIILRTVYENYLYISHVLKNPNMIQEYVVQTVGLVCGKYRYKIDKNGRKNYKLIVDINTLKEYKHGTSNMVRAKFSINKLDIKIHKFIYKYLSEHTHPNMMASGNYRSKDSKQYITEPFSFYLEVPFLLLYLSYILADVIYYYHTKVFEWNKESMSKEEILEFELIIKRLKSNLFEILNESELEQYFKELIIQRIEKLS